MILEWCGKTDRLNVTVYAANRSWKGLDFVRRPRYNGARALEVTSEREITQLMQNGMSKYTGPVMRAIPEEYTMDDLERIDWIAAVREWFCIIPEGRRREVVSALMDDVGMPVADDEEPEDAQDPASDATGAPSAVKKPVGRPRKRVKS